jgi:membrane associated rhomboid family serine protease
LDTVVVSQASVISAWAGERDALLRDGLTGTLLRAGRRVLSHGMGGLASTPATTALVLWLILVWVVEVVALGPMHRSGPSELIAFGALPNARVGSSAGPGDWWRYVASTFLHDSGHPWQLLWNVATLATVGSLVEKLHGPLVFAASMLITAAAASLFWVASAGLGVTSIPEFAVGASGGICGVGGLVLAVGVGRRTGMPAQLRRRVVIQATPVVLATALSGLLITNVNNVAHIGGLIFGGLLGLLLPTRVAVGGRGLCPTERMVLTAVVGAGIVAVVIAGVHASGGLIRS